MNIWWGGSMGGGRFEDGDFGVHSPTHLCLWSVSQRSTAPRIFFFGMIIFQKCGIFHPYYHPSPPAWPTNIVHYYNTVYYIPYWPLNPWPFWTKIFSNFWPEKKKPGKNRGRVKKPVKMRPGKILGRLIFGPLFFFQLYFSLFQLYFSLCMYIVYFKL